ncbi:MAG: response regulator [Gemmatimonadota bacterium]|nr:response regulator [Gemmatimonadota bacterium]
MASLMGGSILVTSEVGRGSEFSMLLPLATEAGGSVVRGMAPAGQSPRPVDERPHTLRILLAEDNPVTQLVAATMLRKHGHQVDLVSNGRDAVAAVQREAYDVVLMDIQMPEMDGFEATAAIRALPGRGGLPIIALTAHAFSEERERCLAAGMTDFLSKPFRSAELLAMVEGAGGAAGRAVMPAAGPPAVDLDTLRRQLSDAGADAALDDIVDVFLASVPERVQALEAALARGIAADIAFAAHALKSSAGTIGAAPLATLLADIEAAARANALSNTANLAIRVREGADAVLADLRLYRGRAA